LMKHQYSPRLYEILKSYQYNNRKWIFEIGTGSINDLQLRLANSDMKTGAPIIPNNWAFYATFNRDVLKPAKEEINKYTDIKIEYEALKVDLHGTKHRKYCVVKFFMVGKTKGEKDDTEKIIDEEYKQIEEDNIYHQISLEEMFFSGHENKQTEEKQEENEIRIEKSKYKILTSMLIEFTDHQIEAFYNEAIKHMEAGKVKFDMREMWVVDYVTHYYDLVKATPEETKTTTYKRLLNLIRKDYEQKAIKINEYDKLQYEDPVEEAGEFNMTYSEAEEQLKKLQEYVKKIKKEGE